MYKIVDKFNTVIDEYEDKIDALARLVVLQLSDPDNFIGYHLQ